MKKLMNIAAIAAILLAFAACQKDSTETVNNIDQFEKSCKKAKKRPFHAHTTGTIAIVYSEENECFPNFAQTQFIGSGTGTHIGNHTSEFYVCADQQGGLHGAFYGTFTAANGDKIFINQPDPSVFTIDENGNVTGYFDIVGGTGRFENATGHIDTSGVDDFVNMTFDIHSDGYITY